MSTDLLLFTIGVCLALGTGVFVGSEFALLNLDRSDLEARRAKGEKGHRITISALKQTSTHLSSAQLGITLTTILTGYTMEPAISSMLEGPLRALGLLSPACGWGFRNSPGHLDFDDFWGISSEELRTVRPPRDSAAVGPLAGRVHVDV